jgi:N-acetyl-anhydromuramyl-L-alanine amidase AmpD
VSYKRGLLVALLCALVAAPAAAAGVPVKRPPVTIVRGDGSYTKASRTPRGHQITTIVIHATDGGTLDGNVWWLSGGHSHASAHYVISRTGSIVQLVHLSDIAWHAGNWKVNCHSIGIEHVGDTYDPAGFTDDEYRSSARLVAWLVRRYGIPVDRQHIIGHSQVPDPNHPGLYGGADHHTDPGPFWRWGYYLNLVRHYAFPERYAVHVDTTSIDEGQTLSGIVPWQVATKRAKRVDFVVDGHLMWSDERAPFAFAGGRGWNTTQIANGQHVLVVRAFGSGASASQRLVVRVVNHAFALTTAGIRDWQKVKGVFRIRANVTGARTTGLGFYVDGKIVSRDRRPPFTLAWNTHRVGDGAHRITLAATAIDGRVARRRLVLVVHNRPAARPKPKAPKPLPAPLPAPLQSIVDGSTLAGVVDWRAHTSGPIARVEFLVDGKVIATDTGEPWETTWDTTTVADGPHRLEVRDYTRDGRKGTAAVSVTTSQPAPPPPPTTTTTGP